MIYFCAHKNRREAVLRAAALNGIDYLEVGPPTAPPGCGDRLVITFLKPAQSLGLTPDNISITGGTPVQAVAVTPATAADPTVVTVDLDRAGDFATYTLALIAGPSLADPPDGLDPQLSSVAFSFKAGCAAPADCLPDRCCPPSRVAPPDINYLAKDYDGFRQVMLDRLAVLTPTWTETHAADLGITMTEALAFAADHLSYQQDAISTEAYLGTARSRISLRRHARLVDYPVSEGCNARTLVAITTKGASNAVLPTGTLFYVRVPGLATAGTAGQRLAEQLAAGSQPVFASMHDSRLFDQLNTIDFYTWGDTDCCLPAGATEATLAGTVGMLERGDLLIFQEVLGPLTGQHEDADPAHRCAVRLTDVTTTDFHGRTLVDPVTSQPITRIAWSTDDALPFPLCLSSTTADGQPSDPVSVARGNVVAADHGIWLAAAETLGTVPAAPPAPEPAAGCGCGTPAQPSAPLPRFYPALAQSPLTFTVPLGAPASAAAFLAPDSSTAVPAIYVTSDDGDPPPEWSPRSDLLSSSGAAGAATERAFVPEIDDDGSVYLRFGDDQYGMAPKTGVTFDARYRIGNGPTGNIGRDALAHAILPPGYLATEDTIVAVDNPLPGVGGADPEDAAHIRQFAPFSYQTQLRCVTETDYGQMAGQTTGVAAARGTLRWTGSWYTAFASIEPDTTMTATLIEDTASRLNTLRMMGTDIAVEAAIIVGLRIELDICVEPHHFQGDVYRALTAVFVTGDQCAGSSGLLNAARFTFGQTVYASPLIAAAQAVDGVVSATLAAFTRMDAPWVDGATAGFITMGRLEVPRCDNDPDHLDRGIFVLHLDGGK